jgi:membrane fusion protein, multidrug efflux system
MRCRSICAAVWFCLPLVLVEIGGRQLSADEPAAPEPPTLPVSQPVERQVIDYVDFAGRTDAAQSVKIIPRVTGYLTKASFKEGSDVKRGDLLFEIDPRPYQAQLDQAMSQLYGNESRLKVAHADSARARELAKTPGVISESDLARYQAAEEDAAASLQAAKASVEVYKLNLDYCRITSPIDGQAGRYHLTPGNLATQDQTVLTTVMSSDPMYVYFEMDERTLLHIRRAMNDGRIKRPENDAFPVTIGLQDERGYPRRSTVDFVDGQLNFTTGTATLRAVLQNPTPAGGTRLLSPGMSVRVRMPLGQPHAALLVVDRAVGVDHQGLKYVYVLDANNTVEHRRVETGALEADGLRVISSGLKPNERILVGGIQQARPKMKIRPDPVPMPTLQRAAGE